MGKGKVSIIIPFYNRVDWLTEAVESVLRQSYGNIEIIVINDGSKEDLTEFCRMYRGKIKYICKENRGPGAARNLGIEEAIGDYIAFLDSDDQWFKDKLEKQVALMNSTNAIWSHTSYSLFRDQEPHKLFKWIDVSNYHGMVFPKCLLSSPIQTSCVMIKSSYLIENSQERFSEKMRYGQDAYLWTNLAINNPLHVLPEVLTKFRVRGSNAAQRARVHLYARSHHWEHIQQNPKIFCGKGKVDFILKKAYQICFYANQLIELMGRSGRINDRILESISKILYLIPYSTFKIYYNLVYKNK